MTSRRAGDLLPPSAADGMLASGDVYLREVCRDNGWRFGPKAVVLTQEPPRSRWPVLESDPGQDWDWAREPEDVPDFVGWQQRGYWLFGKRVRIEFLLDQPLGGSFRDADLGRTASERCMAYHYHLIGRQVPGILKVLALGRWRGRLFRVWERRDEVASLTRVLPRLAGQPEPVLRLCRNLLEIASSLPFNEAVFPFAALSWMVLEPGRLTLARLPYDETGRGASHFHWGTALSSFWNLGIAQESAQEDSPDQAPDRQAYLGRVLQQLLTHAGLDPEAGDPRDQRLWRSVEAMSEAEAYQTWDTALAQVDRALAGRLDIER